MSVVVILTVSARMMELIAEPSSLKSATLLLMDSTSAQLDWLLIRLKTAFPASAQPTSLLARPLVRRCLLQLLMISVSTNAHA
jgi:hypothetical protein